MYQVVKKVNSSVRAERALFYGHWFDFWPVVEDRETLLRIGRTLMRHHRNELSVTVKPDGSQFHANPLWLEKGLSLKAALSLLKLAPEDVVVAGDHIPDLSMMKPRLARNVVAPGSAEESVKEYVKAHDGAVGRSGYGQGVVEAFGELARRRGWKW